MGRNGLPPFGGDRPVWPERGRNRHGERVGGSFHALRCKPCTAIDIEREREREGRFDVSGEENESNIDGGESCVAASELKTADACTRGSVQAGHVLQHTSATCVLHLHDLHFRHRFIRGLPLPAPTKAGPNRLLDASP